MNVSRGVADFLAFVAAGGLRDDQFLGKSLRSLRTVSTLTCCGRRPGTARRRESSRIASPWYGRPERSAPAAVLAAAIAIALARGQRALRKVSVGEGMGSAW